MIANRTKAALQAAKARGIRLGQNGTDRLTPAHRAAAMARARQLAPVLATRNIGGSAVLTEGCAVNVGLARSHSSESHGFDDRLCERALALGQSEHNIVVAGARHRHEAHRAATRHGRGHVGFTLPLELVGFTRRV
jgi:hypothetical protein